MIYIGEPPAYTPPAIPNYSTPTGTTIPSTTGISSGNISDIANAITQINIANQRAANLARIPGAEGLEQTSSSNIAQELSGNVPVDVINQLGQQAAERGISGSNVNADYLRALGLTSLDLQKTGQTDLSAAYARNPAAPIYDAGQQVLTAGQTEAAREAAAALAEKKAEAATAAAEAEKEYELSAKTEADKLALEEAKMKSESELASEQMAQEEKLKMAELQAAYQRALLGQGGGYGKPSYGGGTKTASPYGVEPVDPSAVGGTGPFNTYNPSADYTSNLYANIPTENMFGGSAASPVDTTGYYSGTTEGYTPPAAVDYSQLIM